MKKGSGKYLFRIFIYIPIYIEKEIFFIVMSNLFDCPLQIHEQYDLKVTLLIYYL